MIKDRAGGTNLFDTEFCDLGEVQLPEAELPLEVEIPGKQVHRFTPIGPVEEVERIFRGKY
ncbi:hypothetical protein [Palleronia aestuarii]|uniref:hypothetical protein n=1 Tax=Palleronia aestuarii TaxID=568105 RepID=UPI000DAE5B41|nr:hypothetical protein [Palleronia aestuarii]